MNIKDLKKQIESKTLPDSLIVLKVNDVLFPESNNIYNSKTAPISKVMRRQDKCGTPEMEFINKYDAFHFLCEHYVSEIAKAKNKPLVKFYQEQDFFDVLNSFEGLEDSYQYVLYKDILDKLPADKEYLKNLIIVTARPAEDIDVVEMPDVLEWQIEDYAKSRLPGLNKKKVEWLCQITKYDIHRLNNEIKKISLFNKASQDLIFDSINNENGYIDLNPANIYDLSNAIMKKDINKLKDLLEEIEYVDIEGTGLVTILRQQFLKLINIQTNPHATYENLGMSYGQFKAISANKGIYSNQQLIDNYEFLSGIDYKLKSGQLTFNSGEGAWMDNMRFVDYIICNILK